MEQRAFVQLEKPDSKRWNKQKAQRTPRHLEVLDTIHQRTVILDGYVWELFEQGLRTFAARYGVLGYDEGPHGDEAEFERGVKTLIAELDIGAARQRERQLRLDADPLVRDVTMFALTARSARGWADQYLHIILAVCAGEETANGAILANWRYGHALIDGGGR